MTSSPRSLDLAFARQARATPDAPALVEAGRVTSYAELEGAAGHIAGLLQARDVGDGAIVGLHLERGHSWVAATLGALSTGAAVLPLPPSYPLERRRAIVAGAEPAIVLADEATPVPAELEAPVLDLSPGAGAVGALPERVEDGPPGASPAFVMSSSGTTGRPKLIVRSHRSFFHRLEWTWRTLPFRDGEVGCQKAHQTTTHAVYELFEPLLRGIPSLIVPDATVRDLEAFWSEVRSAGVTRLLLVPSMLRATLEEAAFTPPPIRALILMGEAVPPGLARSAVEAFPPSTPLYSIYGSTEASSLLAVDLRRAAREESGLPLGEPLSADITTQVLGTDGRPVARGETGRLHIRGPALFDEYLGDEELTASVVRRVDGERWFDTRDDVRIHPDGSLRFVGRTDHTVKIRGFRVDLDEVERHLRGLPGVSDAVAVAAPAPAGGGALALHTYVTPSDPDPEELLRQLRDVLPEHAVPSLLRAVDEFPRTSSGKVDRRRLAQEGLSGEQRWSDAGRSDEERALAGIWGRILGHGEFSHDTSFFEAGGSSLSAFALLREVRDRFALDPAELDVTHILANPTIEALARRLSREREGHVPEDHASPGLVVLKTGRSPHAPPLFLLSAAGGTLGAYQRLVRAMGTARGIVGLEDPYLWGAREPAEPFDRWVGRYVELIRGRQPQGPYYICAYSSAGAFGWEVTRRLEAEGETVAALILIDPMALDSLDRRRFGWWAARCSYANRIVRRGARVAGRMRTPFTRWAAGRILAGLTEPAQALTDGEREELSRGAPYDPGLLRRLAILMELESGVPIPDLDVADGGPEAPAVLQRFRDAVAEAHPQLDAVRLERIARQYKLQVQHQRAYALRPIAAPVLMFEPETAYAGLLATLVRPFAGRLEAHRIPVGEPPPRSAELLETFMGWRIHYWCMRDDTFARGVAAELDRILAVPDEPADRPEPVRTPGIAGSNP